MKNPLYKHNDLCKEDRPEYKGANFGVNTLTNVELISLVLNRGAGTYDSVHQATQLMNISNENLHELSLKRLDEMEVVQGIGHCKALALMAAIELGRRYSREEYIEKERMDNPTLIYEYMKSRIGDISHEEMWVLLMNNNYKLIGAERISTGGITETSCDVRLVCQKAILKNATVIALAHNHPSRNYRPSTDDDNLTSRVKRACEIMRLYLVDHVIVAGPNYYSYKENGRI